MGVMTLFLHETHRVRGALEERFEAHYRDRWMVALAEDDDARLVWYTHQAHGTGPAYRICTITAVRDGAAYERLIERVATGDLRSWARELDGLQHDCVAKVLRPLSWSPIAELDLATVPTDPDASHDLSLYMEDTGWPHKPLDDYTRFWGDVYAPMMASSKLLRIEACFQVAFGGGVRPEAVLFQKVIDHGALLRLLETETPAAMKQPGTFMHDALDVRDQWESRLLRTSSWSPLH
jgi:hypothetical protein